MSTRTQRLAAVLTVAALALTGCSGPAPAPEPSSTGEPTTATAPGTSSATPPPAVGGIGDGHWIAGTVPAALTECTPQSCTQARQIPAGTYQTVEEVTEGCFWWITDRLADFETPSDALDFARWGLADQGRPVVELASGAWWQVHHCGTWVKID